MIDNVLTRRQASLKLRITVKALISIGIIALAVVLPQIAHLAVGASAGIMLLPMYLPVLLGGCLLGAKWGVAIGILSPLASFFITSMPAAARLPFMMAELAVFALITGLFSSAIQKNAWMAFPAVILAQVCGRAFFMLSVVMFGKSAGLASAMIWGQIKTGFVGLAAQAVIVPLMVVALSRILEKDKTND